MWLCLCWSFDEKTFTNTSPGVSMMSMTVMHNIRIRYSEEHGWYLRRCFKLDRQLRTQLVLGGSRLESVRYFLLEVVLLPTPPWLPDWQRCVRDKAALILNPQSTYSMCSLLVNKGGGGWVGTWQVETICLTQALPPLFARWQIGGLVGTTPLIWTSSVFNFNQLCFPSDVN